MPQRILKTFRALFDPLRNTEAAERFIAALPVSDPVATRERVIGALSNSPRDTAMRAPRVEALLKLDARLESLVAELIATYTAAYDKSAENELRTWQAAFDIIKLFVASYGGAWRAGRTGADEKRWRALLPSVLVRLTYYKGLDGKFRLFRFSRWTPAQWRTFHEVYELARARGWHRQQLTFGGGEVRVADKPGGGYPMSAARPPEGDRPLRHGGGGEVRVAGKPGGGYLMSVEREYLKTLLLMRLDSGNFTADQVEWVASQIEDWSSTLTLVQEPSDDTGFVVDVGSEQGLRRRDGAYRNRRMLFLDTTPVYTRVVERLRSLPQDQHTLQPGELPLREQRLLLMRLAALFGPELLAITPRAERIRVDNEVRVVIGLQALCSAMGEAEAARDLPQDDAAIARQVAEIGAAIAGTEAFRQQVAGSMCRMTDRSASGCRLTALARSTAVRLSDLIAIRDGKVWLLAVVRRMQRLETNDLTLGVEFITRQFERVLLQATTDGGPRHAQEQPFFALYLPSDTENRRTPHRSLIGPPERMTDGATAELQTAKGHYLVRFVETVEQQQEWSWSLFNAERKVPQ